MIDTNNEWIVSRSGIKERRIAAEEQATSDMAVIAARRALDCAGITADEVELIMVATSSPDMLFPSTACIVQDKIGAKNARAFDLSAGCTGFLYGVVIASQFIATGCYSTVLVIGADTLSKMLNWEDRGTCVLFGDGAGAVILKPVKQGTGIIASQIWSDGTCSSYLRLPAGGSRYPATQETLDKKLHCLQMNGKEMVQVALKVMGKAIDQLLIDAGLTSSDLNFLIPHQSNIKIIEALANKLGLPMEKVMINIDRYANTAAASIPLALEEAVHNNRIKKGDHVAIASYGAGITWGGLILKW